jgi:hypothetical protein
VIRRLARQALAGFIAWRDRRRIAKASAALARRLAQAAPDLVARRAEIERLRQHHRPIRRLLKAQREAMTARLAAELATTLPDRGFQ